VAGLFKLVEKIFRRSPDKEKDGRLAESIRSITGIKPENLNLYKLALMHTSAAKGVSSDGFRESNERLEYLGDAILGAVVAEYLFKKFPYKGEGFLTEIRSRIVNRESLNNLGKTLGLNKLIVYDGHRRTMYTHKSMSGDALEALVGAVYLDRASSIPASSSSNASLPRTSTWKRSSKPTSTSRASSSSGPSGRTKSCASKSWRNGAKRTTRSSWPRVLIDEQPVATGAGFSKKKAEAGRRRKVRANNWR
jgi:ribonuclease-3